MAQTIKLKRGLEANIPTTGLAIGEPLYTTDRYNVYVADSATSHKPATPNVGELVATTTIAATDLVMVHDTDAVGQREKKMTFGNFKTALNIPAASTDELVAASNGTTSGYLDDVLISSAGTITLTVVSDDLDIDIGDGAVDTIHLANDAVTTVKIAGGAVTTAELGASAVTAPKIADDTITAAKMANTFLSLNAVFSGTGIDTPLTIAAGGITNAMLGAGALDVNATTFSGNGTTVELDVAQIDGGSF